MQKTRSICRTSTIRHRILRSNILINVKHASSSFQLLFFPKELVSTKVTGLNQSAPVLTGPLSGY